MPLADTIHSVADTTGLLSDSLKSDTIVAAKPRFVLDTTYTYIPKGYVGVNHPSSPSSESWVFGLFMLLFFILILAASRSTAWLSESVKNFFQVKERSSIFSKTTLNNSQSKTFFHIFSYNIFSLFVYYAMYNPNDGFQAKTYLFYLLAILLFILFKYVTGQIVGYVFLDQAALKLIKDSYSNVIIYLGIVLSPILLLQIYAPNWMKIYTLTGAFIVCIIVYILIIIKLFQIFFKKFVASFYILLYLCTLEILPLIALLEVFRLINQGV